MKFAAWARLWERQACASQQEMQFFVGADPPRTVYQQTIAFVDPACPCRPGHEEWAYIEHAHSGTDVEGRACFFLQVSQPATFRVLFWYDSEGVATDDSVEDAPRYWYQVSVPFGHGCSWVSYPEEDGEYLCCFEGRRIRVLEKLATMGEARVRTLSARERLV